MSFEIKSSDNAKQFIEYLEAFSFANQLTQSIKNEVFNVYYNADFNSRLLTIRSDFSDGMMKIKVNWTPKFGALYINVAEFEKMFSEIKVGLAGEASYDSLKQTMSFIVYDFENLNMLVDLLTEGFKF